MEKYLGKHVNELLESKKVTYRGKVYWADAHGWGNEVYAHSVDEEILGSISGYKVGAIVKMDGTYMVVKAQ